MKQTPPSVIGCARYCPNPLPNWSGNAAPQVHKRAIVRNADNNQTICSSAFNPACGSRDIGCGVGGVTSTVP